jgi:hypothetical protein
MARVRPHLRHNSSEPSEAISAEALTVPKAAKTLPAKAVAVNLSAPDKSRIAVMLLRADVLRRDHVKDADVLGYGSAYRRHFAPEDGYRIDVTAAEPGYGYLLYALLAHLAGPKSFLMGSSSQTQYAQRFWAKQPNGEVHALTPAEVKEQFGVASADALFKGGEQVVLKAARNRATMRRLRGYDTPEEPDVARRYVLNDMEDFGRSYFSDYYGVSSAASDYLGPDHIPRPISPREGVQRLERATQYLRWPDLALFAKRDSYVDGVFSGYLVRAPKGSSTFGPEDIFAEVYANPESDYFSFQPLPPLNRAPERDAISEELETLLLPRPSIKVRNALKRGEALSAALVAAGFPDEQKQRALLAYLKRAASAYAERRERTRKVFLANPGFPLHVRITMPV